MKLDSEEQRKALLGLLSQVPVQTTLGTVMAGAQVGADLHQLWQTIKICPLEDGTPSAMVKQSPEETPRKSGQEKGQGG